MFALHQEVFARNKHGQTQLHRAASNGNEEKVSHYLLRGAEVNIKDSAGKFLLYELIKKKMKNLHFLKKLF